MTNIFDEYSDSYKQSIEEAVAFTGKDHDFFTAMKARIIADLLHRRFPSPLSIRALDVGCGVGTIDGHLATKVKELHGVDTSLKSIQLAKKHNRNVLYCHYSGGQLPYRDSAFDFAFAICVLHHIALEKRNEFVAEIYRVVKPNGLFLIIEHNPFNPLTRLIVARCEFDADAVLLSRRKAQNLLTGNGFSLSENQFFLFFPHRAALLRKIEKHLGWLPLGGQFYTCGIKT